MGFSISFGKGAGGSAAAAAGGRLTTIFISFIFPFSYQKFLPSLSFSLAFVSLGSLYLNILVHVVTPHKSRRNTTLLLERSVKDKKNKTTHMIKKKQ